jgi:D-beta-D-heptose 7-phosphate kinase/D-beta-D-heptose 1-phosphate adenosyltransferase
MTKVFVNGSFDIIHPGHIRLLNYAKSLGTYLLVAIDSDRRIAELKGSKRPINILADRKLILNNLRAVDAVWSFDSDDELDKICEVYRPNIMVKGSDYKTYNAIGQRWCDKVEYLDRTDDSTTRKIQGIINR